MDYLTVVLSETLVHERGLGNLDDLLGTVFDFIKGGEVRCTGIREKRWQFYSHSAVLLDREGEMVGRVGLGGNGGSICVSLSGMGTRWVRSWKRTQMQLTLLRARISRVDLAFDDYEGKRFPLPAMLARARARHFMQGGTPPKWRFIDDGGNGTGCSLYVGTKGHKELCIYEKGKQMKLASSPWVRCEIRLYGKHAEVSLDVLTDPLAFLRGAYDVLSEILADVPGDECTRTKTRAKSVEASATAMCRFLRRQVGPSLNVLLEAFGGSFSDFVEAHIVREGQPGRFRGVSKGAHLAELVRRELCQTSL